MSNLILTGVGGQGSVLAAHLVADAALVEGNRVKLADTFGAATRGGSVLSHVRIGEVWAPMTPQETADVIVALEPLEGLRTALKFLKPGGSVILNTRPWYPVDVNVGRVVYPSLDRIVEALEELEARVWMLEATELALRAGNARTMNVVMLGAMMQVHQPVREESLLQAVRQRWEDRIGQVNLRAYELGRDAMAGRA